MKDYSNDYGSSCNCSPYCNSAIGNSLDVEVDCHESEIRADIRVSEYNSVRLWGRIVNCQGRPVPNALIKLLKVECYGRHKDRNYKGIAHTVTDCDGFYQFEICPGDKREDNWYRILVSKVVYGQERIISISCGNCNPCNYGCACPFDPCGVYSTVGMQPGDLEYGSKCCDEDKYPDGYYY